MPIPDIQDALALLEQGKAAEAIPLLERLIDLLPRYVTPYVLLARAYEADRQWQRALVVWQQAHFLLPNSPSVASGVQRVRAKAGSGARPAAAMRANAAGAPGEPFPEATAPGHDLHAPPADWEPQEEPEDFPASEEPESKQDAPWGPDEVPESPPRWEPEEPPEPEDSDEEPPASRVHWLEHPDEEEAAGEEEETVDLTAYEEEESVVDDLDRLIGELESARIVPRPDVDDVPAPDLDDEFEDVVSETLARIYASQQQFDEAARVYELLAARQPERSEEFQDKAAAMRARASDD